MGQMLSKVGLGSAALTQVTEAKEHVSITIPAGKGGVLKAVCVLAAGTLETVVNGGGKVVLHNSSANWEPFEFTTGYQTTVTEGGDYMEPFRFACEKELPGNTTVTVDYTPYDNQSQRLQVTLIWEKGAVLGQETFAKLLYPLKAAAVTSTSRASPGTIAIPGGRGGELYAVCGLCWPTVETVVNSGGKVEIECDAYDVTPMEFYTPLDTTVGASGGSYGKPWVIPYTHEVLANSNYTVYYTPNDDQSQTLSVWLAWRRVAQDRVQGARRVRK